MDMTGFTGSNYFRAEDLEPDVRIEAKIVSVVLREFEDGPKPVVYTDYHGKGVVLNPTRAKVLYAAYHWNSDDWIGKTITIFLGETTYAGKKTGCVEIEAVGAERIAASPRAPISITSGHRTPPSRRSHRLMTRRPAAARSTTISRSKGPPRRLTERPIRSVSPAKAVKLL
jgi:hypothetical protein